MVTVDWADAYAQFAVRFKELSPEDLDKLCEALGEYGGKHPALATGQIFPNRVVAMVCAEVLKSYELEEWNRE